MTLIHLRTGEVSVVLRADGEQLPTFLHWGSRLPDSVSEDELDAALHPAVPHSSMDVAMVRRLAPMPVDGWRMRPALTGSRADGRDFSPAFVVSELRNETASLEVEAADSGSGIALSIAFVLHNDGLLEVRQSVTNTGQSDCLLSSLEASLPVPMDAVEILDLTGR